MLCLCIKLPHNAPLICFIKVIVVEKRHANPKNKVVISKPSIVTKSCIRHQIVLAELGKHELVPVLVWTVTMQEDD